MNKEIKAKNSNKQTIINLIANLVSYAVSIGISFVLTPFLVDKIGKDTYSFYPMANSFLNYFVIITSALNLVATRYITINIAKDNFVEAKKYFKVSVYAEVIIGFLLSIPMILLIVFVDKILNVPINSILAVRLLFATIFSSGLINIFSSIFGVSTFCMNRIDLRSYRELFASLLRGGLCLVFYICFPPSILYIGVVALIIAISNLIIQFFYTRKLLPGFILNKEKTNKTYIKKLFSASVWAMINSIGNMFLAGMVIIFSNIFYGSDVSGNLSLVLTIPGFLSGIVTVINGVFYPKLTYAVAHHDVNEINNILLRVLKISGGFCGCFIAVFSSFSQSFFSLWVPGEDNVLLSNLSLIVMIPYLFTSCFFMFNQFFIAMNKIKTPALITLGFGFANIVIFCLLGLLKVPYWIPISITMLLETAWVGLFFPLYGKKIENINIPHLYKTFFKMILLFVIFYSWGLVICDVFYIDSWLKFILFGSITGILCLLILYLVIDKDLILKIIKLINAKLFSRI